MSLKLNIRPEIDEEMESLISAFSIRSKTEYINQAIDNYNQQLKRELELKKLTKYFKAYLPEAQSVMHEFSKIKSH